VSPLPIESSSFDVGLLWHARDDGDAALRWFRDVVAGLVAEITRRPTTNRSFATLRPSTSLPQRAQMTATELRERIEHRATPNEVSTRPTLKAKFRPIGNRSATTINP
jgi:hypothetical protein